MTRTCLASGKWSKEHIECDGKEWNVKLFCWCKFSLTSTEKNDMLLVACINGAWLLCAICL